MTTTKTTTICVLIPWQEGRARRGAQKLFGASLRAKREGIERDCAAAVRRAVFGRNSSPALALLKGTADNGVPCEGAKENESYRKIESY